MTKRLSQREKLDQMVKCYAVEEKINGMRFSHFRDQIEICFESPTGKKHAVIPQQDVNMVSLPYRDNSNRYNWFVNINQSKVKLA